MDKACQSLEIKEMGESNIKCMKEKFAFFLVIH